MSQTQQEVRHADSIASGETPTDDKDKKKIKSRRPSEYVTAGEELEVMAEQELT